MSDKDQKDQPIQNNSEDQQPESQEVTENEQDTNTTEETEKTDQEEKKDKDTPKKSNPNHVVISDAKNRKAKWYVIHTYSGHENKVANALQQRAETLGLTDKIIEILIPLQEKIQIKRGQRKTVNEKIFPGYMLVKMEMSDQSWLAVRTTQGVTGFVGVSTKPSPLPKHEVEAIQQYMTQAAPQYKAEFVEGEAVKIVDGPFNDMLGTVSHINEEKGKVEVLVSIFGRETPVELDFLQVQKVE